ncbi:MAG: succinate dehydrogenase, cytochrome b556 subunit [Terracidiphilus sp.]
MIPPRIVVRNYVSTLLGTTAFYLQRVTGVLLLGYLLIHVHTVHMIGDGPAAFDRALKMFENPLFRLLEIGLLGVVILHALNGIRIIAIDFGVATRRQKRLFWILAGALGTMIFIAGALPMFMNSVLRR